MPFGGCALFGRDARRWRRCRRCRSPWDLLEWRDVQVGDKSRIQQRPLLVLCSIARLHQQVPSQHQLPRQRPFSHPNFTPVTSPSGNSQTSTKWHMSVPCSPQWTPSKGDTNELFSGCNELRHWSEFLVGVLLEAKDVFPGMDVHDVLDRRRCKVLQLKHLSVHHVIFWGASLRRTLWAKGGSIRECSFRASRIAGTRAAHSGCPPSHISHFLRPPE